MGKTSIEWTASQNADGSWTQGYTFNPWHGCVKVSPGCANCYALAIDRRFGRAVWGPAKTTPRMGMSENYWAQPRRWNEAALRDGTRPRVFCASMADVFEEHPGVVEWRKRLWETIGACDAMDWLLLTKRPENIMRLWSFGLEWPNVWFGTSVENQEQADKRIPELLKVPAKVRFLSCEPLLGPVDLTTDGYLSAGWTGAVLPGISWVICGGESGPGARPMHPDWARSLRDQCVAAGVAFHFKQWGQFVPANGDARKRTIPKYSGDLPADFVPPAFIETEYGGMDDPDGRTPIALPDGTITDLDWNGGPGAHLRGGVQLLSLGKHAAGRLLDGRTWDQFPA